MRRYCFVKSQTLQMSLYEGGMNLPPNIQMPVKFGNFAEQYLHWFSTNHIQTKFNALF